MSNIDLAVNIKADTSNLKQELNNLGAFGSTGGTGGSGNLAMGGKLFDKSSMKDPGAEAQKFMDMFGKKMESLKNDRRLDVMGSLVDQMNDPGKSMQQKAKIQRRIEGLANDMDIAWRNTQRVMMDKGGRAGISKAGVLEGMIHGVGGDAAEMYMNAGQIGNQAGSWATGGGGAGGGGAGGGGAGGAGGIVAGGIGGLDPNQGTMINKYAKKAAGYLIGYMIADVISNAGAMYQSMQMAEANIYQRGGTTFDMGSVMQTGLMTSAMHRENILQGLQIRNQGYSVGGSLAGLGIGLGVGILASSMTGGLSMGIAPMIGSRLGGELGGIYGTQDITTEMRKQTEGIAKDKMVGQLMGLANQRVGIYDDMDTARARFRARTGTMNVGGTGTGYTDAELYGLGTQQAGVTGHFDKQTFTDQLRFSRAYGFNPSEIFSAGVSTRYTGQNVGASELFARKELAERTGMGSRLPELIQALNQLTGVMTKVGANATESSMMQAANLPFLLFGDTARGRMGDQGMDTLMGLNSMFGQQAGSAGDAFLFQAMKPKDLWDFKLRKEKGIFGEGNLESIMNYAGNLKSPQLSKHLFSALGVDSPSLVEAFVTKGFNKDGTVNKEFIEQFKNIDINTKEGTQQMAQLLNVSEDAISNAEKHKKDMVKSMVDTGEKIAKSVHEMQKKEVESQNAVLKNQTVWDIVTKTFEKSVFDFQQAVNKMLGIQDTAAKNTNWNIISGSYKDETLAKLSKKEKDIEIVSSDRTPMSEDALFFQLLDQPEMRKLTRLSPTGREMKVDVPFYKFLKINRTGLEKMGYPMDKIMENQENINDIQKNNPGLNVLTEESVKTGTGEGRSSKGHTIIFNINAATRAGIHAELDNHLDSLASMAHPTKLVSNF